MSIPQIPEQVTWKDGLILLPEHFKRTDRRVAVLAQLAARTGDPWPWGYLTHRVDATALAASRLRIECSGVFPDGEPFSQNTLSKALSSAKAGDQSRFYIIRSPGSNRITLQEGDDAPNQTALPAARLVYHGDVWNTLEDWSPPAMIISADHPMRADINQQLGSLAALAAGFVATLRLPGAEARPVARVIAQVSTALIQGVGVLEALLAAPAVSPGRLGIEALRLALGVRGAVGQYEAFDANWDNADQRGSLRTLLYAAEAAASGIGLPFRANAFRPREDDADILVVEGVPSDSLVLAVEGSRPSDVIAARTWLSGAALASPDRIQEALTRRVEGCRRQPVERDPHMGISSGPLLALYRINPDLAWRGGDTRLALAAKAPPPPNTTYSVLMPEGTGPGGSAPGGGGGGPSVLPGAPPGPGAPMHGMGAPGFAGGAPRRNLS